MEEREAVREVGSHTPAVNRLHTYSSTACTRCIHLRPHTLVA
jgi:hypothetical protein